MADIIEAAESGYVSLDRDDIRKLNDVLLGKINHALQMQEAIVKAQWELPLLLDRIKKGKDRFGNAIRSYLLIITERLFYVET